MNDLPWRADNWQEHFKAVKARLNGGKPPSKAPAPAPQPQPAPVAETQPDPAPVVAQPAEPIAPAPVPRRAEGQLYYLPIGPGQTGPIGSTLHALSRAIIEDVCSRHNVSQADVLNKSKKFEVVRARQEAIYLIAMNSLVSLSRIGRVFGGQDHTTILHAIKRHAGLNGLSSVRPELPWATSNAAARAARGLTVCAGEKYRAQIIDLRKQGFSYDAIAKDLHDPAVTGAKVRSIIMRDAPHLMGWSQLITKPDPIWETIFKLRKEERCTYAEISRRTGKSEETVRGIILKYAPEDVKKVVPVHVPKPSRTGTYRAKVVALRKQGMTPPQIVKAIGSENINAAVVRHILNTTLPSVFEEGGE